MNRWQGWAASLRLRHARVGGRHVAGPMVLLRSAGASPVVVRTRAATIVHLHARWHLAPHLASTPARAPIAPAVLRLAASGIAAHDPASASAADVAGVAPRPLPSMVLAARAPAPALAPAATVRRLDTLVSRWTMAVLSPVRASLVAPAAGVHAREVAARVRRDASRQEPPRSMPAAVLARPSQLPPGTVAAGPAPSTRVPTAQDAFEQAGRLQAPPAFNVEALTGLVIQQIDRRLVAWRERMGRG